MKPSHLLPAAALIALTLLGFFWFPGHTWLQQDTQIYVAILEHLRDPSLLASDPVAIRPHVTYTVYDEIARLWPQDHFRLVLQGTQIALRLLALLGVYWLAAGAGLAAGPSLFVAGCFGLGATITGPAVLTIEYEPVPRGFALCLLVFSLGLMAHARSRAAATASAVAFMIHPPTAIPQILCAFTIKGAWRRFALALAAAGALLFVSAKLQVGEREAQQLFGVIGPDLEKLQRMRASYNWLSQWQGYWLLHYPLMGAIGGLALFRLRAALPAAVRWWMGSLMAFGLLMMPVQYILLEHLRWTMMSSYQAARAVLFTTMFATILCSICAARAARFRERFLWLLPVFAIPLTIKLYPESWAAAALLAGLAAAGAFAIQRPWAPAVAVLAALLIPTLGQVRNFPALHTPELAELSAWASNNTRREAVFVFGGFNRDLAAGIFRVKAGRTIYVDWKGGGQVNLLAQFAIEWWDRWQKADLARFREFDLTRYAALGIDYAVVKPEQSPPGHPVLFQNARYAVLSTKP